MELVDLVQWRGVGCAAVKDVRYKIFVEDFDEGIEMRIQSPNDLK